MGLDNEIIVKSNKRTITRDILPATIKYPFDEPEAEILYWRKNWGLRNAVMNHFGWMDASEEQYEFYIDTPNQVLELIEIVASFLDEEKWENEGDSIWSYEEARPGLVRDIVNLALIHAFMCENLDVYLEFYDSY